MRRRSADEIPQIDLTPMLDVIFIMLIFFIVSATYLSETALDVRQLPTIEKPLKSKNSTVVFEVSADGDIVLAGRRIDIRSVRANVERLRAENPETKVIVSADPNVKSATYIRIADQTREGGVFDISLSLRKNNSPQ